MCFRMFSLSQMWAIDVYHQNVSRIIFDFIIHNYADHENWFAEKYRKIFLATFAIKYLVLSHQ